MSESQNALDILVVDDSSIYRSIVTTCLAEIPQANTIGMAKDGEEALAQVEKLNPDLVLLDVVMPVMDGLETLKRLRNSFPEVGIIMVSGLDRTATLETMTALKLGAFDFIVKPTVASGQDGRAALRDPLQQALEAYSHRNVATATGQQGSEMVSSAACRATVGIDVAAICTSTGGPSTLCEIIPRLPSDLSVPLLIAQRMPSGFTQSLAESLDRDSEISVSEASDGELLLPGHVYIAPGGQDMTVERTDQGTVARVSATSDPAAAGPSADKLFESLAQVYGRRVLSVVLTGVGEDGLRGVMEVRSAGGYSIVQDHDSSTVFDQPSNIISAGEADEVLPTEGLTQRLIELSKS